MESCYKIAILRLEVREDRSFNPDEFAICLETDSRWNSSGGLQRSRPVFFRTCFTCALQEHSAMALRRLTGETANTARVLTLVTQFGEVSGGMGLGALAIPQFNDVSDSAKMNACRANMRTISSQQVIYYAQNRKYTSSLSELGMEGVRCPSGVTFYVFGDRDEYTVRCSTPGHGEIVDGNASWTCR